MITKVYLAGASKEIERARQWAEKLRDADIMLTSTWVEVIGRVGAANPATASPEQLTKWTLRDIAEVQDADLLWLLLPAIGVETVAAYVELGVAYVSEKRIVTSGPHRPIFTPVLADESFAADVDAFDWIQKYHRHRVDEMVAKHLHGHRGYMGGGY